ncbi:MAG: APC family permease [Vulcanisaeta sp. AZ3]|jgi:amino acid transporter
MGSSGVSQAQLKRELSFAELVIIGVAGAVGTGILFSAAAMTGVAGPGSWLAWLLGGIFYLFIGLTYAELAYTYPEAGGPSRYVLYTHGWFTNLINSLANIIWYLFIPPIEAFAVVEGLAVFYPGLVTSSGAPTLLGGLVAMGLMVLMIPFNYFGVRAFGRTTFFTGIVKLILYVALGFALAAVFYDARNLFAYHGFLPFGFAGVFLAIPFAMFAFGGIRVIPDYAEETRNPGILPLAIVTVVVGQLLVYLLLDWVFVTGIDWARLGIKPGDWAAVGNIPGNPFIYLANSYSAPLLLVLTIIVGIIGPFVVGYIYLGGGARVVFAQGRSRVLPELVKDIHKRYYIPYWALLILAIIGAVLSFVAAPVPTIYNLIEDAVVAGYLAFAVNPVAMIVTRRQGVAKYKVPGGIVVAALAFAFSSLVVFWSGWITVYYSVILLAAATVVFGVILPFARGTASRDLRHVKNSLWYIFYIVFLVLMTYVGSDGALNIIPFNIATAIVAVVSVVVFFPLGIWSGLKQRFAEPDYAA